MAFTNFVPEIWSKSLLLAKDKKVVAVQNCWRQFEGDIKNTGDRVHITGLTGATVKSLPASGTIDDPEEINDSGMDLIIDQKKYVNFGVGDVDKIQAAGDVMPAIQGKTANNYAIAQDSFVYQMALAAAIASGSTIKVVPGTLTSKNVLDLLGQCQAAIESNDVLSDGDIMVELNPWVFQKFKLAFAMYGQPNNDAIANGYDGNWFGSKIFHTNTIPVTSDPGGTTPVAAGTANAYYWNIVRTQEAISFAEQKSMSMEAYRPEKKFMDAIKGFGLYGGKITRPSELVIFKVQLGTES